VVWEDGGRKASSYPIGFDEPIESETSSPKSLLPLFYSLLKRRDPNLCYLARASLLTIKLEARV